MYKSQQLKGLSRYSKRKQQTLWHIGLCLSFLAILKNIHALGDSVFLPFYNKKIFLTTPEKKMLNIKKYLYSLRS